MAGKAESSNSSNISQQNDKEILAKLRRLKIQETILTQNLLKTEEKSKYENSQSKYPTLESKSNLDSNDAVAKVKDSFIYVRNLFDEIKTQTHSRELLADIDFKEMKDKVSEFETKLKSLKFALNSELKSLRSAEEELIHQVNEQPKETNKIKLNRNVYSAKYNNIVPSPVKTLMTSPFKCLEVQEFQDFMKNSGNRYGGWIEYNHNIFVKDLRKCFGSDNNFESINDNNFLLSEEYEIFIHDLLPKLKDITESDIKSHTTWYIKYLCLKNKQQRAIERWKWSRRSFKDMDTEVGSLEDTKLTNSDSNHHASVMLRKECSAKTNKIRKKRNLRSPSIEKQKHLTQQDKNEKTFSTLMKPTAQWVNRTYVDTEPRSSSTYYSVENIEKLCIPNWRFGLKS